MNLGNKITKLRKKEKISQEILAEKIGVTRQTISNWELNTTKPDVEQIKKISKIFDVSIDELLDNDIRDIMEKKISNTEKLTNKNTKNIKILLITLYFIILAFFIWIIIYYSTKKDFTNMYQNVYTCTIKKEDIDGSIETRVNYLYWNYNEDGTFSVIREIPIDDGYDNNDIKKGMYGEIVEELNVGKSFMDVIDALDYVKNLLLYRGAICR